MKNNNELYKTALHTTASRLKALNNTIASIYAALEMEQVETQALDAIECIGLCVREIQNELNELS